MKKEIFKDVPGYEGLYQISNLGRVKSLKRKGVRSERILKHGINSRGYLQCNLHKDGVMKTYSIHQLMAMAFLNHVPDGFKIVVDHKNNIQTDNRLENLQLITSRENTIKEKSGGTSNYIGVCHEKRYNKWRAEICIDGKAKYLGTFDKEEEAAMYYQNALKSIDEGTKIEVKRRKYKGVSYYKNTNKWKAYIKINGKHKHIGYYLTEEEAHIAHENYKKQLN